MTLWHLSFPLTRHRGTTTPAFRELVTESSRERSEASAVSAFAALVLFGPEPGDRALAGWCPGDSLAYAETELRQWLRAERPPAA